MERDDARMASLKERLELVMTGDADVDALLLVLADVQRDAPAFSDEGAGTCEVLIDDVVRSRLQVLGERADEIKRGVDVIAALFHGEAGELGLLPVGMVGTWADFADDQGRELRLIETLLRIRAALRVDPPNPSA